MKKVTGKAFENQRITLDNHHYDGCTFQSCALVYSGKGGINVENSTISSDCKFHFTGAAANTVASMQAIYSIGEWGRRQIVATFQQIAPDIKNLH